jgi:AbrB family looped-hinge helix DNA binding protein
MENQINNDLNSPKEFRKVNGLVGESSFSIVLPKSYAVDLGIGKGDFVMVTKIDKKIIVEKA